MQAEKKQCGSSEISQPISNTDKIEAPKKNKPGPKKKTAQEYYKHCDKMIQETKIKIEKITKEAEKLDSGD